MIGTIFSPAPLLDLKHKYEWYETHISYIKKASLPLTCWFCYGIKKNELGVDIIKHPYLAAIIIYTIIHYSTCLTLKKYQKKIDEEIISMMQHIFHILVIGHGIFNKVTMISYQENKASVINSSAIVTLQFFLQKAYKSWFILFSYYQKHYKNKPLYAYNTNEMDIFEVLQAAAHEQDILPFIIKFYDKKNKIHDFEPIINYLEIKLNLINHKLIHALPKEYHSNNRK
jgi:hypothetical protein